MAYAGISAPRQYLHDVLQVVLKNLNLRGQKALAIGLRRSRRVPDADGQMRDTALFEAIDYEAVQAAVWRLQGRITAFEEETGIINVNPMQFVPTGYGPPPSA